jgi:hypothetical protein
VIACIIGVTDYHDDSLESLWIIAIIETVEYIGYISVVVMVIIAVARGIESLKTVAKFIVLILTYS